MPENGEVFASVWNQFQRCPFPRCDPRGNWHTSFRKMDEFIGKTRPLSKTDLSARDKKNLTMFLKLCFLSFRYFFITCKHINIRDKVNYILFITVQSLTWTLREQDYFAFKTSLAIFEFMKVELKYWRFGNSNDAIFKTVNM